MIAAVRSQVLRQQSLLVVILSGIQTRTLGLATSLTRGEVSGACSVIPVTLRVGIRVPAFALAASPRHPRQPVYSSQYFMEFSGRASRPLVTRGSILATAGATVAGSDVAYSQFRSASLGRNIMRLRIFAAFVFAMSVSILAGTSSAQVSVQPSQNAQSSQVQQQSQSALPPGQRPMGQTMGGGMMNPQMRGPMGGAQSSTVVHNQGAGAFGPAQSVFKLLAALDDARVRTMLGITDQQADSLHKLVLDTETFTITTAAAIAVNSLELRELLRPDKPDRAAVMGKGDAISKSTSDLISHYLDAMLTAKQILTPEQQKMIQNYMENGAPPPPPPPTVSAPPARR